jgi:hypothetical protein
MFCSSCQRQVSLWLRPPFSKVCQDCLDLRKFEQIVRHPLAPFRDRAEALRCYCNRLLSIGTPPTDTELRLIELGMEVDDAANLVAARVAELARREARKNPAKGIAIIVFGIVVFLAGGFLVVGNRGGVFPTFPYAGTLTTCLGCLIMGSGEAIRRGRL